MPIIGPAHRQPAVLPKHFKTFASAGLSLTGIAVGVRSVGTGESGTRCPTPGAQGGNRDGAGAGVAYGRVC